MANTTITLDDRLLSYMSEQTLNEPDILRRLREETRALGGFSQMQIAPEQGQLMALLVRLTGTRRMLEVGTFTGYSALCCALAMPEDGQLVACDISEDWTAMARRYWQTAGVADRIDLRIAPAVDTLKALVEAGEAATFDMMFIDADKTGYDTYYELGLQLLRPGGLMLLDNMLWRGAVADPTQQDPETKALRALTTKIQADTRVMASLVPIADGLTLVLNTPRTLASH